MKRTNRMLQILAIVGAIAAGTFYFKNKADFLSLDTDIQSLNANIKTERARAQTLQKETTSQAETIQSQQTEIDKLSAEALLANNQLLQIQRENKRLGDERDAQELAERRLQKENSRLTAPRVASVCGPCD